jgi:hypothetical protein
VHRSLRPIVAHGAADEGGADAGVAELLKKEVWSSARVTDGASQVLMTRPRIMPMSCGCGAGEVRTGDLGEKQTNTWGQRGNRGG